MEKAKAKLKVVNFIVLPPLYRSGWVLDGRPAH
jgi:hypothetical protein